MTSHKLPKMRNERRDECQSLCGKCQMFRSDVLEASRTGSTSSENELGTTRIEQCKIGDDGGTDVVTHGWDAGVQV